MNWVDKLSARTWSILVICMLAFAISGCQGSDGAPGATGSAGPQGPEGPPGPPGPVPDDVQAAIDSANVESCGTCHGGAGDMHQAEYAKYNDASNLDLTIVSVTSADDGAGGFVGEMLIHVERDGMPVSGMSSWTSRGNTVWGPFGMSQMSFYTVSYDSANRFFSNSRSFSMAQTGDQGGGDYLLTSPSTTFDPVPVNGQAYGYLVADPLHTEGMTLYDNVVNSSIAYGDVGTYQSLANSTGCENCHGSPYMKHGYREAAVDGLTDFAACKSCHYDNRGGNHEDWQYMVDDSLSWANDVAIPDDGRYDYNATVMNDTHMSHAMEFPYPQSMSTCATCHAGNIAAILDDDFFTLATCKSCHVVEGINAWPEDVGATLEGMYAQPHRPPPLEYLWARAGVDYHNVDMDCGSCHGQPGFSTFAELHSGYDKTIYDANGARYSATNTVAVDSVTLAGDLITVDFSATNVDIEPTLAISFYGWDSKHFIVPAHDRDGNGIDCPHNSRPGCNIEWSPGSTKPFFTEEAGSIPGDWSVTFDMSLYQAYKTDPIPQLIADGVVKFAEVTILPELAVNGAEVNLEAFSTSFDLGGMQLVDDYYQGTNAAVDFDKCGNCHDNLSALVHTGSGRYGDSMQTCKACHATTFPGGHLEQQSRSIDSYVHAIHTFQPLDEDDVLNGTDPVFAARNELHKGHKLPYFTALACESCHVAGTYNAPDQAKSMPGAQSASWNITDPNARAIGTIPEYVTGPASRACGSCHRADMIVRDDAGGLATFNAHTEAFGTLEENDADDQILFGIIDKIMSMFE